MAMGLASRVTSWGVLLHIASVLDMRGAEDGFDDDRISIT
jgi:hypothetical protein